MDVIEICVGINVVLTHEPGERGAEAGPVASSDLVRFRAVHSQRIDNPLGHPDFNLLKEPRLGWIERVVEVEDPGVHVAESGGHHG